MNRKFMYIKGNNPDLNVPFFNNKQEYGYAHGQLIDKQKQILYLKNQDTCR